MENSTQQGVKVKRRAGKTFCLFLVLALALGALGVFLIQSMVGFDRSSVRAEEASYIDDAVTKIGNIQHDGGYGLLVNTLASEDLPSSDYWVLSCNGILLYMQDQPDANKYLGQPVFAYPVLDAASELYDLLADGTVVYKRVTVDGVDYLVSATRFNYNNVEYELWLVKKADPAEANLNAPFGLPVVALYGILGGVLLLLVLIPTLRARSGDKKRLAAAQALLSQEEVAAAPAPEVVASQPSEAPAVQEAPKTEPEPAAAPEPEPEPVVESAPEPEAAAQPKQASTFTFEPPSDPIPEFKSEPAPKPEPQSEPEPASAPEFDLQAAASSWPEPEHIEVEPTDPEPKPEPEPESAPEPEPEPAPAPEPEPVPQPAPQPEPVEAVAAPVPEPAPVFVPEPMPQPEPAPVFVPQPEPQPEPVAVQQPEPQQAQPVVTALPITVPAPRPEEDLSAYLSNLLATGVDGMFLVRVDFARVEGRAQLLQNLTQISDLLQASFDMNEGALALVIVGESAEEVISKLSPCIQGVGSIATVLPVSS